MSSKIRLYPLSEWRKPHSRRNRFEYKWLRVSPLIIRNPFVETRKWAIHKNCAVLRMYRQIYNRKVSFYHIPLMSWDMWEHKYREDI